MMGGRIGVESAPGRRQHVLVHGPACRPRPRDARRAAARLDGLRVLIVDDNATNREILERRLASWRMQRRDRAGGEEGLERIGARAAAGQPYDLVLLDHHMPGLDGLGVARAIGRRRPERDPAHLAPAARAAGRACTRR